MQANIVLAHPESQSFNAHLTQIARAAPYFCLSSPDSFR